MIRDRQTVLITGASGGIGLELARVFAKNGFDLIIVARWESELEALAERWHQRIREELRIAQDDAAREEDVLSGRAEPAAVRKLFSREYQGARYSFGYPACPDLRDQEKLQALLPFNGVEVSLSETWQLHPEQSTSALICHHPEAKYFTV